MRIIHNTKPVKGAKLFASALEFKYEDIFKSRQGKLQVDENNNIIMQDPYSAPKKISFEHAWRDDPVVRLAINKKVDFIIGERPITVLDTTREFTADEDASVMAFNNIVGNKMFQDMKTWVDRLNATVKYHEKLKAALVQMKVFGRSVLAVEKFDNNVPADLKVLNSEKLGEVTVENESWQLHSVTYDDFQEADNIIMADSMIYFTNLNYNITPNTLFYGYSDVEPIVNVSECNRIIDQIDLKEINAKLWGAFGVIKFLDTKDPNAMNEWLKNFKPGTWMATDANVEVILEKIEHDLRELVEERNENDLRIARGLYVPSFLVGFENITNRATVKALLEAWKVSVIGPERTGIKNIVEPQWYDSLVRIYLNQNGIIDTPVKIKQEFEDIIFDNLKDQVESYLPIFDAGLMTGDRFLRAIGLDYIADEAKLLENKQLQNLDELKTQLSTDIDGLLGSVGGPEDVKRSIETEMLKTKILNDVETKISDQINFSMKEYIMKRVIEKIGNVNFKKKT